MESLEETKDKGQGTGETRGGKTKSNPLGAKQQRVLPNSAQPDTKNDTDK